MGEFSEQEIVAIKNTVPFLLMIVLRRRLTDGELDPESARDECLQFLEVTHPHVEPRMIIRIAVMLVEDAMAKSNIRAAEKGDLEAACFLSAVGLPLPENAADLLSNLHASLLEGAQSFKKYQHKEVVDGVLDGFRSSDEKALTQRYFEIRKELDDKYGGKAHRRRIRETLYEQVADELKLSVDGLKKRLRKT